MTRAELIRRFVLNEICDDYEDIEQIEGLIHWEGPACGLTISHEEIIQSLRELIEFGYAKAWDLEPKRYNTPPHEYPGMPAAQEIAELDVYFMATPEGKVAHETQPADWPIDDDNNLRQCRNEPKGSALREGLIRDFALDSFWDRYMNIEHINKRIDGAAGRCGMKVSREEKIQALSELIDLGYAKAWRLDQGDPPTEYVGMPPLEDVRPHKAYFDLTPEGLAYHLSDDTWWPFEENDDGELIVRKDWTPPAL
jgi:hypothetical protein